jgi:5-methylthioadenosine/S-adenosylhomocysteine deaminase
MATVEGAKAMGLEGEIGRLEVGMKADMIIVKVNELWSAPCNDPYFYLVNCVSGNDVRTVIIDGKVVMKDGRLKTVDEEHLMDEIGKRVPQIMDRFEGLITQR